MFIVLVVLESVRNKMEKVFESDRINFVNITDELVDDYTAMINDREVQSLISHIVCSYSRENELKWIEDKIKDGVPIFSMIEKDSNKFIGNIEILHIKDGSGELGISINQAMQNKHYGTEAIKRMLEYAFYDLKLTGMSLYVFKTNKRAIKCYQNCGFVIEGDGRLNDEYRMIYKNN